MAKYVFVTGGVVSGLGKGITAASLGRLLKMRGYKVASQKLDPYINIDPGTMSPYQHGEVFVTEDGAETDLDLGHYERFIDEDLNKFSNLTTGKVYWNVLNKERAGEYLGQTVQVIPHITNEIKSFIYQVGKTTNADIVITEIGGTTGDIESQPFIEAIRQVAREVGRDNCCFIHVTLVPYISGSCEFKSKPTQHSVKELQGMGIFPDIIVARVDSPMPESIREKIAMFCNVRPECCIENMTVPVLYEAPVMLEKSALSTIVCKILNLDPRTIDMTEWMEMLSRIHARKKTVKIALCGKYVQLHDAYLSVAEALAHGGYEADAKVEIEWVDTETLNDKNVDKVLKDVDGILIPGGFGVRGARGCSDRGNTAASQLKAGDIDWEYIFGKFGVRWFHTGGIFAALSETTPDVVIEALKAAKKYGTVTSYDLNYRPSLWKGIGGQAKAQEVNKEIARYVDVMIGNEEDFTASLGFEVEGVDENLTKLETDSFKAMIKKAVATYPNFKVVATTLRAVKTATFNDWGAICYYDGEFHEAIHRPNLEIFDRVGGGDSFASGLVYGFLSTGDAEKAVNYGAAHGALAMTTPGDTSMALREEVEKLMKGGGARVELDDIAGHHARENRFGI